MAFPCHSGASPHAVFPCLRGRVQWFNGSNNIAGQTTCRIICRVSRCSECQESSKIEQICTDFAACACSTGCYWALSGSVKLKKWCETVALLLRMQSTFRACKCQKQHIKFQIKTSSSSSLWAISSLQQVLQLLQAWSNASILWLAMSVILPALISRGLPRPQGSIALAISSYLLRQPLLHLLRISKNLLGDALYCFVMLCPSKWMLCHALSTSMLATLHRTALARKLPGKIATQFTVCLNLFNIVSELSRECSRYIPMFNQLDSIDCAWLWQGAGAYQNICL